MNPALANALRTAFILFAFALAGTALLATAYFATRDPIAAAEEKEKLKLILETLPAGLFDNDVVADRVVLPPAELLGTSEPSHVYRARLSGQVSALVFEAIAPDGYGGPIKLLVAVRMDGELAGVRVVSHRETPGLGDYIEAGKSDWIAVFTGLSLTNTRPHEWRVKKDGGRIPYVTGATITPRAVVKAVHRTLEYFAEHGSEIARAPTAKEKTG